MQVYLNKKERKNGDLTAIFAILMHLACRRIKIKKQSQMIVRTLKITPKTYLLVKNFIF